jgi:hypothetical protein
MLPGTDGVIVQPLDYIVHGSQEVSISPLAVLLEFYDGDGDSLERRTAVILVHETTAPGVSAGCAGVMVGTNSQRCSSRVTSSTTVSIFPEICWRRDVLQMILHGGLPVVFTLLGGNNYLGVVSLCSVLVIGIIKCRELESTKMEKSRMVCCSYKSP